MAERVIATIDAASGNVVGVTMTDAPSTDPLPANTRDITTHPDRAAIERGDRRWNGSAFVAVSRPAPPAIPALATLTDRQLLEGIARALGVAR
jgi:hypothetical protein